MAMSQPHPYSIIGLRLVKKVARRSMLMYMFRKESERLSIQSQRKETNNSSNSSKRERGMLKLNLTERTRGSTNRKNETSVKFEMYVSCASKLVTDL